MPRLAPVTIATRPESPRSMGLCLVDRSHGANRINDRNQNLGPHPEEAALLARPSRRMATGTISPVAVLRDARKSALLRTRLTDDVDMIRTMETLYQAAAGGLLVRPLELAQQVVAAFDSALERYLGWFLSGEGLLQLLLDDIANLHERAEPQALGVLGRLVERNLPDGGVGSGVAIVIALRARKLVGRARDRQVPGVLVPPRLGLGARQEGEEFRDALIFGVRPALEHPERGAADDRVLRRAFDVGPVGLHAVADLKLRGGEHGGARSRRAHEDAALAGDEFRYRLVGAPAVVIELGLLPFREGRDLLRHHRPIDLELGVKTLEAVGFGGERYVVIGGQVLDQHPGRPFGGNAAGQPRGLQFLRRCLNLGPRTRRRIGV